MTVYYWSPLSDPLESQVDTITISGTWAEGDVANALTYGGVKVSYTAGATPTPTTVAAGLLAALQASELPQFSELTFTAGSATTILVTGAPGVPFYLVVSETGGSSTIAISTTTEARGPNIWDEFSFATGAGVRGLPGNGDTVIFRSSNVSCLYGLTQDSVSAINLDIQASYTGRIGLRDVTSSGYDEWRPRGLHIHLASVTIGEGAGRGSSFLRFRLATGDDAVFTIYKTAGALSGEPGAVRIGGTGSPSSTTIDLLSGSLYVDVETTITDVSISSGSAQISTEVTGTAYVTSGQVSFFEDVATLTVYGGQVSVYGNVDTLLKAYGGLVTLYNATTIADLAVYAPGQLRIGDSDAKTVTVAAAGTGSAILDPQGVVTWTGGIQLAPDCDLSDLILQVGNGRLIDISTPT